jgi:hypothetical protein
VPDRDAVPVDLRPITLDTAEKPIERVRYGPEGVIDDLSVLGAG